MCVFVLLIIQLLSLKPFQVSGQEYSPQNHLNQEQEFSEQFYNSKQNEANSAIENKEVTKIQDEFKDNKITSSKDFLITSEIYKTENILNTQGAVELFSLSHYDCDIVKGDLIIEGEFIQSLENLKFIKEIRGSLIVRNTSNLKTLKGLNSLKSIQKDLKIEQNFQLENLLGLDSLKSIGGSLKISSNNSLQDLEGLLDLQNLGKDFIIENNSNFISFSGLSEFVFNKETRTSVRVSNNSILKSLAHFQPDLRGVDALFITENQQLSTCNTWMWCDFFAYIPQRLIEDNAAGCNSEEDIEFACEYCPKPIQFDLKSVENKEKIMTWQSDSSVKSWQIAFGKPGFDPNSSENLTDLHRSHFNLRQVDSKENLEIYIRSVCSEFSKSEWFGPYPIESSNSEFNL
ncbi:receptor L domain-containing protein [Psychroflexus aestuariivivens]|uniref:hypothetical protein n=1 Tax=Psychroflexus aestuariivivens TaxID=1795040 RepID=UPI0013001E97|nr:hypothetical protein [Psychroflexus aestuariivivens]